MHPSGVMGMGMGGGALSAVVITTRRWVSVRTANIFSQVGINHARRVSWAPHTTDKKQGAFAKLARSNFNDPTPQNFSPEPYFEQEMEAYRAHHRPDIPIYKFSVSATPMSLRE
ncbi:unnamed protein product [Phytomonas sp. Hart1]|nr:unnamed protein product [Phytomonas sp. Hart1]|eukprot:CCW72150.1 unnamed protein product [Phytomonas sp. isolate Hart1]